MKLIVQPDDGLAPLLRAVRRASRSISLVVFRFDRVELERALSAAVARGVNVRALVAHTNGGQEKTLRKLELRLLEAGMTVARTANDLPRYHGKMTIVDDTLFVLGFNYTAQDIERSRSFGVMTRDKKLVSEASSLFEADATRQPFTARDRRLVVSPEGSRALLADFLAGTKKQLQIYDERLSDKLMIRLLNTLLDKGVDIRVIGKVDKGLPRVPTCKPPDLRLHVRAIIRDGSSVFVGSQSLRKPELDTRREIGLIIKDSRIARKMKAVFEADWQLGRGPAESVSPRQAATATEAAAV